MISADERVVAYQLAVARSRNGDPHLIFGAGADPLTELRRALDDGRVDEAIVAQNRALGSRAYDDELEGTFSSGEALDATAVLVSHAIDYLRWSVASDEAVLGELLTALQPIEQAWRLATTFLNAGAGLTVAEDGAPAFFDSEGRDYAWLLAGAGRWCLIITSFYPCPRPFP